jgi:hypothetical protein
VIPRTPLASSGPGALQAAVRLELSRLECSAEHAAGDATGDQTGDLLGTLLGRPTTQVTQAGWLASFSLQPVRVLILRAAKYAFVTLQLSRNHTDCKIIPAESRPYTARLGRCDDVMGQHTRGPALRPRAPKGRRDAMLAEKTMVCWSLVGMCPEHGRHGADRSVGRFIGPLRFPKQ